MLCLIEEMADLEHARGQFTRPGRGNKVRETVGRLDGLGEKEGNENWEGITGKIRLGN